MTVDDVEKLAAGLTAVLADIEAMPDQTEVADAQIHCSHALLILSDYARYLRSGMEPYEALHASAVGEFNTMQKRNFWGTLPPGT